MLLLLFLCCFVAVVIVVLLLSLLVVLKFCPKFFRKETHLAYVTGFQPIGPWMHDAEYADVTVELQHYSKLLGTEDKVVTGGICLNSTVFKVTWDRRQSYLQQASSWYQSWQSWAPSASLLLSSLLLSEQPFVSSCSCQSWLG